MGECQTKGQLKMSGMKCFRGYLQLWRVDCFRPVKAVLGSRLFPDLTSLSEDEDRFTRKFDKM